MATLQKVKLMATQCASLKSPTRSPSPSTSPVIRLRSCRRRKTLKMLLSRRIPPSPDRYSSSDTLSTQERRSLKSEEKEVRVRRKLKDLFVASPEEERRVGDREDEEEEEEGLLRDARFGGRISWRRPLTASFRNRLLFRRRRNWRPVLFTIPEIE